MGVVHYEMEYASPLPPARIFNAILDDNLIPKILPQAFKSVEIIEGDGGPGSVKLMTFGEGSPYKAVKHKVEKIDKDNFTYGYTLIEGDALMGKLEKIYYESKFVPSPDGGTICKNSSKYYTIGDYELTEEHIKGSKEKGLGLFKVIEAHLLAHPDAYC